jgi:HSP90 family molecular chaperone
MVDPIDNFMVTMLHEFDDKPLKDVDDATLDLPQKEEGEAGEPAIPEADFNSLVSRFVQVLGDKVNEVRESKVLRDSPCRLVSPDSLPGRQIQRVYKWLDKEFQVPAKILEINRRHPLIQNLARLVTDTPEDPVIDSAVEQLYENQLIIEGIHQDTKAQAFASLFDRAIAQMV